MSTNLDELSPFDMQVLNMAQLQKGALEWTQTTLCIPHIGTLEVVKDGRLQLRQSDKPSRWCRALSPHGQAALAKLHWELLTSAIDTDERDADMKAQRDLQMAEMRANMGLGGIGGGSMQSAIARQQAAMNQSLIGQVNQALSFRSVNPPVQIANPPPAAPPMEESKSEAIMELKRKGFSLQEIRQYLGL